MNKKIIILETFRNKDEHYVDITKCTLSIFSKENPIIVINDRHLSGNKPELKDFQIETIKFYDSPFVRIFQLIKTFVKYRKYNKLYLSTYPIFNLFSLIFDFIQQGKSYHLIHGELSVFLIKKKKFRQKINFIIQKFVYKNIHRSKNVNICFLDNSILNSITNTIKISNKNNLISLDWPIDIVKNQKIRNKSHIEIGLFGTHNKKKQSQLINYLESNLPNNKFLFKVVGHNDGIVFNKNIKIVKPKEPNYHVDQSIFFGELSKCDYILSLSNAKDYEMIWSGTVITALKFSVPILTLKNKTFNHYSKLVGSFGYEFENIEKMLAYLSQTNTYELRKSSIDFSKKINEYDREKFKTEVRNKFKFK